MSNKTLAVLAVSALVGFGTFTATAALANSQVAKQGSIARDVMTPDVSQIPAGFSQPGNSR
ncbi:MAG: hypothetical protein EXQ86_08130 [Rhodospirillales bacterium]|nr:hypothetical protein [Rhodospirillales bacterium]